ncbi:molybdopterin biosynthesis MoaE protein [Methanothermus fervidus DSM 2088]|uniref:Molybdopterin biosynthesis MoaE protein n=1 Tax=Methanothermus fervidus (strain ATCC 43054 / DSM 2088 / JCM 10308 / V24 S) TaxID=523846 RepID=E3GX81_METFV|nr:molybdenum cofactor biosynthesis protein MoaE [Methanothermus fervidus]ADP78076.1 molybdopterin biosynthesis MoaE protein [Methanothermus fervidus DSM 2088]
MFVKISEAEKNTYSINDLIKIAKNSPNIEKYGCLIYYDGIVRGNGVKELIVETNEKSEELLIKAIEEIEEKYNVEINAILHVGKLRVSDSIFMATVASKHRYEAFDAIKELIDVVKNKIGLTKKEIYK